MDARDEINNYIICEEINGALLLTGQWGCGKTHLVKEMADKFNKENKYAVLIISLFGIDSLESLSHKIKESIFWIQTLNKSDNKIREKASKAKDTITHISSIFSEHSKIAKSLNTVLSIEFYNFINIENRIECWMGEVKVYKELILVFDDLERSKLNKVELLGAINNYLENKKHRCEPFLRSRMIRWFIQLQRESKETRTEQENRWSVCICGLDIFLFWQGMQREKRQASWSEQSAS